MAGLTGASETSSPKQNMIEEEIQLLKQKYQSRCKIIKNLGAHIPYIVKLVLADYDVTLKFQVPDDYPVGRPLVIISWTYLSNTSLDDGLRALMTSEHRVTDMIQSAETWLKEHQELLSKSNEKEVKKRGKERKKKKVRDEEKIDEKKASMKTATDVISRIQWDSNLQSDLFTVGYIDRFLGIVEKSFCVLSWEDIASVDDHEVLAIPKHRIEYFKFREFKVWDKKSRTDYVFGSSGEKKMTIFDVIENYNDLTAEMAPEEQKTKGVNDINYDSDDSDDDGLVITTGTGNMIDSTEMTPDQPKSENDFENDFHDNDEEYHYWTNKLRPNYFVAVRIEDDGIRTMVDYVQDILISRQSLYESCCTPLSALHITLCTMRLDTAQQLNLAISVIKSIEEDLKSLKSELKLEGTDTFFSRVLYAKVQYEPKFLEFVDTLKLALRTAGIELQDGRDFVPHMTLMKTSRPVSRQIGKDIPKSVYADSGDITFGEQIVDNLNLCSIEESWGSDGFYSTPLRIEL